MQRKMFRVEDGQIIYMTEKAFMEREKNALEGVKISQPPEEIHCNICQITFYAESAIHQHFLDTHFKNTIENEKVEVEVVDLVSDDDEESYLFRVKNCQDTVLVQSVILPVCEKNDFSKEDEAFLPDKQGRRMDVKTCSAEDEISPSENSVEKDVLEGERDIEPCLESYYDDVSGEEGSMPSLSPQLSVPSFYGVKRSLMSNDVMCSSANFVYKDSSMNSNKERITKFSHQKKMEQELFIRGNPIDSNKEEIVSDVPRGIIEDMAHSIHYQPFHPTANSKNKRLVWCKICDTYYKTVKMLKNHIWNVHKMDPSSVNKRNTATWDLEIAMTINPPAEFSDSTDTTDSSGVE